MSSDWDTVTVLKKKPLKASQLKTESAVNQASKLLSRAGKKTKIQNVQLIYFIFRENSTISELKLVCCFQDVRECLSRRHKNVSKRVKISCKFVKFSLPSFVTSYHHLS